ncbi:MAG: ATP-binding protein [Candidatus Eisenbacteria bacterium]
MKVRADLERVVMRALEREPVLRQGSADEFMEGFGVEERVGVILGGKFVGRGSEIDELERILREPSSNSPTYVQIAGPVGSGRSALIAEIAHRAFSSRVRVIEWDDATLEGLSSALQPSPTRRRIHDGNPGNDGISGLAEHLLTASRSGPILVTSDPPDEQQADARNLARRIARYVAAVAIERQIRFPILIVQSGTATIQPIEVFERTIALEPFDGKEVSLAIRGLLGAAQIESELQAMFAEQTSGQPNQVVGSLLRLVQRGILVRRAGEWRFLEREQIRSLDFASSRDNLAAQWPTLVADQHASLLFLAVVVAGLPTHAIAKLLDQGETSVHTKLDALAIRGWALERRGAWRLSSVAVVDDVLALATPNEQRLAAQLVADRIGEMLGEESLADVRAQASRDHAQQMVAVRLAQERHDFRLAERRASRAESWARASSVTADARGASLARAEALHRLGRDRDAKALLLDSEVWSDSRVEPSAMQGHSKALGRIQLALGELEGARACFEAVIKGVGERDFTATVLNAHADLAEIEWRHGDGQLRDRCIFRLRSILGDTTGRQDLADPRAGLLYQLGAALIETGRREEARDLLEDGLREPCGPYWRMRVRNALATAVYYLGDFERTLSLLGEAWKDAELGGFDSFKARILSNRAGLYYGMGRFSDAVEHHGLSAMWARRTGSTFEFLAASLGASINFSLLAKYESAIDRARDAWNAAAALPNPHDMAKALEMEAFALHQLGDDAAALSAVRRVSSELGGRGFDDVQPRLDWLEARIEVRAGNFGRAQLLLEKAEAVLLETKDWEDLPGVQIELDRLAWRRKDPNASWDRVRLTTTKAVEDGALVVALRGALVLSEILADRGIHDGDLLHLVQEGLTLAESGGAREYAWRISAGIGHGALRSGEREVAQKRFGLSVRVLREVAGELSEGRRRLYLGTPHAQALLRVLDVSR